MNDTLGCAILHKDSISTSDCPFMTDLSNFAVASSSRQIEAIGFSYNNNQEGLLMVFSNSLGRVVVMRGSSDRDNNTNWSWQDETQKFDSLLANRFTPNVHIASQCVSCSRSINKTLDLTQYYLYCFTKSENISDDSPYHESIVEFTFLVGNDSSPDNFTVELS